MSKLTEIHIEGFCSLRDIELTKLGPVTVLIGPNGSGKSNLLSALRMVTMMATKTTGLFVGQAGGASALLHYGPQQTPVMNLRLEFETDTGTQNAYRVRLGYAAGAQALELLPLPRHLLHLGAAHQRSLRGRSLPEIQRQHCPPICSRSSTPATSWEVVRDQCVRGRRGCHRGKIPRQRRRSPPRQPLRVPLSYAGPELSSLRRLDLGLGTTCGERSLIRRLTNLP